MPGVHWAFLGSSRSSDSLKILFYPFFPPISWYPIGSSYSLVSSLQLQYGLGRGEGRKPCVLWNTTQPSRTASWHNSHPTRKLATPMCRRKHHTPGDLVSVHCAWPDTGVASARWDKDIPAGQTLPNQDKSWPIVRRPMGLPVTAGCDRAWALRCSALDHCATREAF
jgi:hypothetical protein